MALTTTCVGGDVVDFEIGEWMGMGNVEAGSLAFSQSEKSGKVS